MIYIIFYSILMQNFKFMAVKKKEQIRKIIENG